MDVYLTFIPTVKKEAFLDHKRHMKLCWQKQGIYIGTVKFRAAKRLPFFKDMQALLIAIYNPDKKVLRAVKQELTDSLDCNIVVRKVSFRDVKGLVIGRKRILAECAYVEKTYEEKRGL